MVQLVIWNGTPERGLVIDNLRVFDAMNGRVKGRGGDSRARDRRGDVGRRHGRGKFAPASPSAGRWNAGAGGADRLVFVGHVARGRGLCHGKRGVIGDHVGQLVEGGQLLRFKRNLEWKSRKNCQKTPKCLNFLKFYLTRVKKMLEKLSRTQFFYEIWISRSFLWCDVAGIFKFRKKSRSWKLFSYLSLSTTYCQIQFCSHQ